MYGNALFVLYCFIAALVESKLETGIIRHFLQVSVEKCVQECEGNQHCKSVKYVRLSALCTLYRVIQQESSNPGVYVYSKNLIQDCTNGQCWSEDKYDFCGDPVEIYGTKILGNMASVGSKIKYVCLDGSEMVLSECLTNGSWSLVGEICICSKPGGAAELFNIQKWTSDKLNSTHIRAIASCSENSSCLEMVGLETVCEVRQGAWKVTKNGCCNIVDKFCFSF